jgi:hypothetical protein
MRAAASIPWGLLDGLAETQKTRTAAPLSLHRPWVLLPEHAKVSPSDA